MTLTETKKLTPDEIEAKLQRAAPVLKKFSEKIEQRNDDWANEIAILESRVASETVTVYLDGERKTQPIKLRVCLSDMEMRKIAKLFSGKDKLDMSKPEDVEKANDLTYEIIEMVTANPMITKEWLKANTDKYSQQDMLALIMSFMRAMEDRAQGVAKAQNFR
jgi:hypothetical protein